MLSLARSLDGESVTVYLGDGDKGEPINDAAEQEQRVQAAIEEGIAAGKTAVLLKAETKVRLADLFRISSLVAGHDLKLHVAVLEREGEVMSIRFRCKLCGKTLVAPSRRWRAEAEVPVLPRGGHRAGRGRSHR